MKKAYPFLLVIAVILAAGTYWALNRWYIKYDAEHFDIAVYTSATDRDGDGMDDQTDILLSVREYIATTPKYKSKYYESG